MPVAARSLTLEPYLKIGCAARLLCRFLARPSLYVHVLSRDSLRAFAYSSCSPHFEIGSSVIRTCAAAALCAFATVAHGAWPEKSVRLMVGFAPGGSDI